MLWGRTRYFGPFNDNRIESLSQQFVIVHIGGGDHDRQRAASAYQGREMDSPSADAGGLG